MATFLVFGQKPNTENFANRSTLAPNMKYKSVQSFILEKLKNLSVAFFLQFLTETYYNDYN